MTLINNNYKIRVRTLSSSATPTPNFAANDAMHITALAANATFGAPTGGPADGQKFMIRVKDNGTARTLAWNAVYRPVGAPLPTTTFIGKTLYCLFAYNSADNKYDLLAASQEV